MDSETRAEFAKLHQRLDAIESALTVRSGPFAGVKPGPAPAADPAKLAALRALLADLGQYAPGDSLLARWLSAGYSPEGIRDAIYSLLDGMPGETLEERAYYFSVKAHAGGGWKNVYPELAGEDEGPIVNPDPESDLLAGLPNVTGPADLLSMAVAVSDRASRGVTWRGNVALSGEDLARAKAALDNPRAEWRGWIDPDLLRVLVLTNVLPLTAAPFSPYPDTSDLAVQTLPEWLYGQWVGSRS